MIHELAQGIEGIASIAWHLPGQAVRTLAMLPPADRKALAQRAGLGDTMTSYYFGNPQLYRMPEVWREPGPALTPSVISPGMHSLGAFKQDSLAKAMPYIAMGIIGIVAYNILAKKKSK